MGQITADDEALIQQARARLTGADVHDLAKSLWCFRVYLEHVTDDSKPSRKALTLRRIESMRRILRKFVGGFITAKQTDRELMTSFEQERMSPLKVGKEEGS